MGDTGDSPNEKGGWARPHTASQLRSPSISRARTAVRVRHSVVPLLGLGVALLTACGGSHPAAATNSSSDIPARWPTRRSSFGAWAIGGGDWEHGWGPQDDEPSIAAIHHALEHGINWIDTAAAYGFGHS